MTRVTWPIGAEVVYLNEALADRQPVVIYKFMGYPKGARTKANFSREVPVCKHCGSTNVTITERSRPEWFVLANDPDLPGVQTAYRTWMTWNEIRNAEYRDKLNKFQILNTLKWNDPNYQAAYAKLQAEWANTTAYVFAENAKAEYAKASDALRKKYLR